MKDWNKREVGDLEENIKQVEKEIDIAQGVLMTDPHNASLQKKNFDLLQKLSQL